jgi:hypothetical protein
VSSSRPVLRRCAAAAILVTTGGLAATLTVAPAQAMPSPNVSASCLTSVVPVANRYVGNREGNQGGRVSAASRLAMEKVVKAASNRREARALPATVVIPVRAHVLKGTHKHEKGLNKRAVRRQVKQLNIAYAGQEAPGSGAANTRFRFRLKSIRYTKNDKWFHTSGDNRSARQMKKKLHQGKRYTLNIYFVRPRKSSGLLGFATFPQNYHAHPKLDGLIVNIDSRPGGKATNYNQGDTAVHEIGHWLGLFHVFNDYAQGTSSAPQPGDCGRDNDGVSDTPVQAYPTFGCPEGKDSCPANPGVDSIHNFMDYSYDPCMYGFTPGQSAGMDLAWAAYRAP